MPPVLDPSKSKVDGLAFLGLSLARKSDVGHPGSQTHQTAFDLNEVQDREYENIFSTNDDGWLVGGGEPGPPHSYKLAAPDSAHVEMMRIGTFEEKWGGIPVEKIIEVFKNNKILVPEITVVPTDVVANNDHPPELEIRFDMEMATVPDDTNSELSSLPVNWQLRFIHNQLFRIFHNPSRFCPGAFHSTILRKAEFRSDEHREKYFTMCKTAVDRWKSLGPQPLVVNDVNKMKIDPLIERIGCPKKEVPGGELGSSEEYKSGLWLFTDRENITHFFEPNFLPPYDTPAKRKVILEVLSEEWDEETMSWKPCNIPIKSMDYEPKKGVGACNFGFDSFVESLQGQGQKRKLVPS